MTTTISWFALLISGAVLTCVLVFWSSSLFEKNMVRKKILVEVSHRSAHTKATPAGGGIIIVSLMLAFTCFFQFYIGFEGPFFFAFLPSALLITGVGFLDDIKELSAKFRLLAYGTATFWFTSVHGSVSHFTIPGHVLELNFFAFPLTFLFILWMSNLVNFMDGINGLVTGFTCLFAVAFALFSFELSFETSFFMLILAAASLGFLPLNFPKAKIFLGDTGSVFIGFTIAVFLVKNANNTDLVATGLILLIPLTVDATMTLFMRLLYRENILKAHNRHLYQRLNVLLQSHAKTTSVYLFTTALILLPVAWSCTQIASRTAFTLHFTYALSCVIWIVAYLIVEKRIRAQQTLELAPK